VVVDGLVDGLALLEGLDLRVFLLVGIVGF
jgi:hypothetical protein